MIESVLLLSLLLGVGVGSSIKWNQIKISYYVGEVVLEILSYNNWMYLGGVPVKGYYQGKK